MVKRRHEFDQGRQKGFVGMEPGVGLGVITDKILNNGRSMEKRPAK